MIFYNEEEVRKTIAIMKPDNQIFECRVVYGNKQTYSGYFSNADGLLKAVKKLNPNDCNVYFTLNTLKSACYSRSQRDRFEKNPKTTTAEDVVGYDWLLIDLDPKRVSGTSATDEEVKAAKEVGNKVYIALKNLGFEEPIVTFSGNGVHLLYKIHVANTEETRATVKKCLEVVHIMFTTDEVDPDLKVFDPNRITKLYGFLSQKGANTEERPHRLSYIIGGYEKYKDIKETDIEYLRKLANIIPDEPEKPQYYNNYNPRSFDLEAWFQKYNIEYKAVGYKDGTKYILDHCPFDENHKGKDAAVFKRDNGALGFVCLHSSCAGRTWKDFRMHYEPNAYEKRDQWQERQMYQQFNRDRKPMPQSKPIKEKEGEPVFLTAKMILERDRPKASFIRTGIETIDKKMRGLKKGHVSVWSGLRASAKSTVLSQIALNARNTGNNVAVYSGELTDSSFMDWMNLQAAGKGYVRPSQYGNYYYTPKDTEKQIADWLEGHFWLYNNEYGNDFQAVMNEFVKKIEENKLDLLILDNLMAFNIASMGYTKWDAQSAFTLFLASTAKKYNVHICFVAHPKKANGFLRFDDISGTADIGNAVDDAFIVHRNNNDFKRLSKEMFKWNDDNEVYQGTNVIEIVKDRDGGNQDVFIPLYYETETKRLKNEKSENIIYGWCSDKPEEQLPSLTDFEAVEDDLSDSPFN